MISETQEKAGSGNGLVRKIAVRIISFLIVATLFTCVTRGLIFMANRETGPAGFAKGMVHGALMPCALPNLLIGNDVTIYAAENTGRTYKLGYTVGVNSCGAIFFGIFFWRVSRWKRMRDAKSVN